MVASAQGLDVSNYQGKFNWSATRGLSFGIFRLTQGTTLVDPDAAWNHAEIADRGLHRMAYHFLDPSLSGRDQALFFIDHFEDLDLTPNDALWLDNETANGLEPAAVAACAVEFIDTIHATVPHNPNGVYTFIDFAKEGNCVGLEHESLWLAYPASAAPAPPMPWTKWTFWQWGTRNGDDADAFNGTAAQLQDWIASFVGAPSRIVADGTKSLEDVATSRKTTIRQLVDLSIRHEDTQNLLALGNYLVQTGPKGKMPKGLVYWTV